MYNLMAFILFIWQIYRMYITNFSLINWQNKNKKDNKIIEAPDNFCYNNNKKFLLWQKVAIKKMTNI